MYLSLLGNAIIATGTVIAALLVASLGVRGYRAQKKQDREEELIRRRQREYERYLTSFLRAGRWKTRDLEKHAEAEDEYHEAHGNILLIGSDEVIQAANEFHSYYVSTTSVSPKETKLRYSEMVIAMRQDGFEETKLSVREVAMNIPWIAGDEEINPIDWEEDENSRP